VVEHVVDRHGADEAALVVDDGHRDQVVGRQHAGDLAERRLGAERLRDSGLRLDQPRETRRALLPRPTLSQETFGRWSEAFARFMGTAQFLIAMTVFVVAWILWNTLAPEHLRFDPYAFIFLTLMLSLQASYAAPLILLAQNRQADRDRVSLEEDRARNERSIADTEYLTREVAALRVALGEVATRDFLRSELQRLLEELDGDRRPLDESTARGEVLPASDNGRERPSPS
jgi:uncharacterized membrane protein